MLNASDIMTTDVITVSPDTPVLELADILFKKRINGVPVLDENGKLYGIVSQSDLIDQAKKLHIPTVISILDAVIVLKTEKQMEREIQKVCGSKVSDICTKDVITVKEDTPVDEIATIMSTKRIHSIPVMDGDKLVGIVGKSDILRALSRDLFFAPQPKTHE